MKKISAFIYAGIQSLMVLGLRYADLYPPPRIEIVLTSAVKQIKILK